MNYTHRLAVIAYLIYRDKFLLLKRNHEPKIWGPPGGRLEIDEDPGIGILREVQEECGLSVTIIAPVDIWYGPYRQFTIVSIDYLAIAQSDTVVLSSEHSEFRWSTIQDLREGRPFLGEEATSFKLSGFEKAWTSYQQSVRS